MNTLTTEAAFREAIANNELTIAVFKATWCKDCHFIDPFMPDLMRHYEGKVSFVEIDRDELPDICSELNILGIPSFIAFRRSQELIRFVSKLRKTRDEIEHFVERAIGVSELLPNPTAE